MLKTSDYKTHFEVIKLDWLLPVALEVFVAFYSIGLTALGRAMGDNRCVVAVEKVLDYG